MKNINLNISITIYDRMNDEMPDPTPNEYPPEYKLNEILFDLEDNYQSMKYKTLKTLSKITKQPDVSYDKDLKDKLDKAADWIMTDSNLQLVDKEKICKWLQKDLPFYIFKCNTMVEVSDDLKIDKDGEAWKDEETDEIKGFSSFTLDGNVNIQYNFESLSAFFDETVESFQEESGITIPKKVFSIINIKETVDELNKVEFIKDNILDFYNLKESDVTMTVDNNASIDNKQKSKIINK